MPNRPATVPTADAETAKSRLLVLDLDASRVPPEDAADRPAYIARAATRIVELIEECGGRCLVDVSPSGGRHVYVLWAQPIRFFELTNLVRAFAARFPVVDSSPMESLHGQIRGPGSPHKSLGGRLTGFMTLTCSVDEAEAICARPCGSAVWDALLVELAAELDAVSGAPSGSEARHPDAPDAAPGIELDLDGRPYRLRLGGRGALRADLEHTARTGNWDAARYRSSSEARQAILTSAAARGWRLQHVRERLTRDWTAIAAWWRDDALLDAEWAKAVAFTTEPDLPPPPSVPPKAGFPVQRRNTSASNPTRGERAAGVSRAASRPSPDGKTQQATDLYDVRRGGAGNPWAIEVRPAPWTLTTYQQIRTWQNAMRIVERLLELEWGNRALTYRAILRAVGAAAQMSGRTEIEFGTRQLAYMAAVDHTTVSRALHDLCGGPYALIDHVRDAQGVRADLYQLVIPDSILSQATGRTWRPGRIEAIHPAFRPLTRGAAFAYEALTNHEIAAPDLAAAALLPRSTAYQALAELAAYGLAERGPDGGWRRGTADLDQIATWNKGRADAETQLAGHRTDRAEWHAFLGITAQDATEAHGPCADRHRLAPAPRSLVPPPRLRPITERDLARPPDVEALLDEIHSARAPTTRPQIPDDVRAEIRAAHISLAADERTAAEQAEYENELNHLHLTNDTVTGQLADVNGTKTPKEATQTVGESGSLDRHSVPEGAAPERP
ncbi:hypothetical protein BJF79_07485 [Actinomadura sp. CNU-125]|uniref:hypothetical protein n=1 Tax=Actinomadura sp. CNU-125 TaxID=1904961 RepID=UPI0009672D3F|nr:hypothetical protein [Actinomadura sp. CNU-125]OLT34398.1 hypothetical protein BJF79_07485 [Actinomadura sp. CNU-125]